MKKWYMVLILELSILMWLGDYEGYIVISFLWVILHEFAHMIVASKFGCKFNNVNISIFGAKVELSDIDELTERKKMILYLAGPFFNIFMAVVMCYLYGYFKYQIIEDSIKVNFFLGAFNLLPAYPLDGSRVCEILLSKKLLYKRSKKITEIFSFIISGTLFLIFIIIMILHKVNISLFLAVILITYATFIEKEKTMYIIMGDMIKKIRKLKKHNYIENKSISVYYKKGLVNVLSLVDKNKFNSFYILNDDMELISIIHEDELIKALKDYGNITLEEYVQLKKKNN
ncbi:MULTISPECIES: M50 family metallopeptidase [Clostridium]|jgi:Zn-dependent proteases|uniref:M50 family metallopeptidase n=4 Tax=Clostridium TaxID=1485 RepID=A0A0B5QKH7_CLOBE|nr:MULTISPECIES: M50 family metallopeptidase [Clostridium]ABR32689.1 peptidase M50 [Clostridium beijerinckii NCIMB 8052]AIU03006.1 peptidase M50 [Clostridium beijerinckii ATCC 35702]AJG97208.1 peptidase M50 [Clostridium beijerinckii]AQS03129.1 stage IV sporulation protein FB [Clostridium beijerinckii]AVK49602.1 peptidase M50 [Clostridium sp. MF28]